MVATRWPDFSNIASLSDAYDLIERTRAKYISLGELLEQTLKPYAAVRKDRIRAAGPDVQGEPRLALSLHMVLHELVTNASKYGALSRIRDQHSSRIRQAVLLDAKDLEHVRPHVLPRNFGPFDLYSGRRFLRAAHENHRANGDCRNLGFRLTA